MFALSSIIFIPAVAIYQLLIEQGNLQTVNKINVLELNKRFFSLVLNRDFVWQ
jgi:hypothetical protein